MFVTVARTIAALTMIRILTVSRVMIVGSKGSVVMAAVAGMLLEPPCVGIVLGGRRAGDRYSRTGHL